MNLSSYACSPYQTNSYLLTDEETGLGLIVDPGGYVRKLSEDVKEAGVDIKYILLTHSHSDHTAGLDQYKEEFPDAQVVVHEVDAPRVTGHTDFGTVVHTEPDILAKDGDVLEFGNVHLQLMHTPGHTKGGMCIYIPEAHVLFSGDTLFQQSIGRTDFVGGSFPEISESIRTKLYTLPDDTQVFPGHMGPTTIGFEKEHNPFVSL